MAWLLLPDVQLFVFAINNPLKMFLIGFTQLRLSYSCNAERCQCQSPYLIPFIIQYRDHSTSITCSIFSGFIIVRLSFYLIIARETFLNDLFTILHSPN